MEEVYKKYAEITAQIKKLEEEKTNLNEKIIIDLKERDANKLTADFGTFSLIERRTWKYSKAVDEKNKELKEIKKQEEKEGIAEAKISNSLRFQSK